ncbi:hypothetical protein FFJ24_006565 [Pedobacter sp. KBS0701]|uniref:hypothetical protein n=1 Tax=Pedobacter sp. KBS0701 TaxID=2578106 RepID=UPI00110D5846|nr:hypothetical protein [Pedobacter sp. KBS0701]QDW24495.1 hypothetical protein FFJ24_006565 [Pedobacter sp. KBS0701]
MKLLNYAVVCFFCCYLFSCSGQVETKSKSNDSLANEMVNAFKGKSLEEINELLKSNSEQIEGLFKLMDTRLEITPAKSSNPSSIEGVISGPAFTISPEKIIGPALNEMAKHYEFSQKIFPEGSVITTSLKPGYTPVIQDPIGKDGSTVLRSEFIVHGLYFHDHSSLKDNIGSADSHENIMIKGRKPIDSLKATVKYTYITKMEKVILDEKQTEKKIGEGTIKLKQLGDGSATFTYNGPEGYLLSIAGMDTQGRLIDHNSSATNSIPSAAKRKFLDELNEVLKSTTKKIDAGKYKNVDELITDLKATLPSSITEKDAAETNSQLSNYHFYQDISKIVVYYAAAVKTVEYQVTLRSEDIIATGLSIGIGEKQSGYGIVQADGSWLIKPSFKILHAINPFYYGTCEEYTADEKCEYFRLDAKNKKMIPFEQSKLKGYVLKRALNANLVLFQQRNIDPAKVYDNGVMDKNGNVIMKPVYYDVWIAGNYLITAGENGKTSEGEFGLYTLAGKPIIQGSAQPIGSKGNFIFIEQEGNPNDGNKKYKLLDNRSGKNFLPEGTFALETNYVGDALLVSNGKGKYLMDKNKNKKADLSEYVVIKQFVGNYALVKSKAGYWGVINNAGKLVVACANTSLSPVYNDITLITDAQGPEGKQRNGLLNIVTGRMIVPLMYRGDNDVASVHGEASTTTYYIAGKKFDAFGKEMEN